MPGLGIIVPGNFGATGWATGQALVRQQFVGAATRAFVLDARHTGSLFQDRDGTVPVTAIGQPVRRINDRSGQGRHAILRAAATSVPTWQGDGSRFWVDVPLASGFHIANPLPLTDWAIVGAIRVGGGSSGTSWPVVSQLGVSANGYIALQISRVSGNLAVNLSNAGGHELSMGALAVGADAWFRAVKNVAAITCVASLDGAADATYTGTMSPPNNSAEQAVTELFSSEGNAVTTAGRLYYLAFVNAIRDPAPLAAIAASRIA